MRTVDLRRVLGLWALTTPRARWGTAIAVGALLLTAFWASGNLSGEPRHPETGSIGAALFFAAILAYSFPVFAFISQRTTAAIEELSPLLHGDSLEQRRWREQVFSKPLGWFLTVLAIGLLSGIAHNLVLYESAQPPPFRSCSSTRT